MDENSKVVFRKSFDLHYENVPLEPLKEDEVLIRTKFSLISPGTELALYTGTHVGLTDPNNRYAKYPFYPGYAAVGEVVELGGKLVESSSTLALGDLVYFMGRHAAYNVGSFSNERDFPVIRLNSDKDLEQVVFTRLAAITMTSIIQSNIQIGDTVAVIGMGLIGNLAAQLYALMGANVVAVDVIEQRLQIARETGITQTILSGSDVDLHKELESITGESYADIVVEATGSPKLIVPALDLAKQLGQVVALGSTRGHVDLDVYKYIHSKGINFVGAHEGLQHHPKFPSRLEISRYILRLIEQNALKLEPLITHRLSYSEAKLGYDMLLNQQEQALGVLLQWNT